MEIEGMMNRSVAMVFFASLGWAGCASPDATRHAELSGSRVPTREAQAAITPAEALQRLKDGNDRFVTGRSIRRDLPGEIHESAPGQFPFAAILSCIDSRVSPELVFDRGLGEIFSARVAGNIVNDDILGSLEFATRVAGAKLILVVGHSACGAVKGAINRVELGHLTGLLGQIEPSVEATKAKAGGGEDGKSAAFVDDVARENVRRMVRQLTDKSPILRDLVASGALKVVGGFQDLSSGRVVILE
jgi:carbonic anhydrase